MNARHHFGRCTALVVASLLAAASPLQAAQQADVYEFAIIVPLRDDVGTPALNRSERDALGNAATEQRYHRDSVEHGVTIAEVSPRADVRAFAPAPARLEVVISAHLDELDLPRAPADSTVLWVDIESPTGSATHAIRVRDLMRRTTVERFEHYQTVSLPLGGVRALTIRVRFAGNATVGVREIKLAQVTQPDVDSR
jgi:hypothetical protein